MHFGLVILRKKFDVNLRGKKLPGGKLKKRKKKTIYRLTCTVSTDREQPKIGYNGL